MSKELVIGSNRHETKVAVLEEDQLTEIYFQRANEYSLAGSIHKGRVTRVLPGMQSAFVDLGLERDTFLYVSDFFEENEDIDTVSDEKVGRGDHRDRGAANRVPDRTPVVLPELAAPPAVQLLPPPPTALQHSEDTSVALTAPSPTGSTAPNVGEELDGDKGFRGGDRRGRRSRRRRTRGRGIPENKYAQPGAVSGETPDREPLVSSPDPEPIEEDAAEERDVIILPGESLAKYRRISVEPEAEREPAAAEPPAATAVSSDREPFQDTDPEAEKEIEARADELELADKVLGHHFDEDTAQEEERVAEVRADVPPSPFVVDDVKPGEAEPLQAHQSGAAEIRQVEFRSEPALELLHVPSFHVPEDQVSREENAHAVALQEGADEPASSSVEAEFPGEVPAEEGLSAAERAEDEISAEEVEAEEIEADDDFEGADLEDSPTASGLPGEGAPGEGRADEQSSPVQRATVRDQNGRYMHRVSRRMRRRRGGNRFSQQGGTEASPVPSASSAGTASAMAAQPEPRNESPREARESSEERSTEKPERVLPSITELLKPGQEIIVQIAKEPLGQKGARITSHIALPGRYVVFMPSVGHLGVSRKIASDEERQRLKRVLQAHRPGTTGGFIVRTAGEGIPEDEIAADMDFLYKLWLDIRQKAEKKPAPALLHYDLDVVQRILRDQVTEDFKAIWVDSEEMYEHVLSFTQRFQPALVNRVKMYTRSAPIFDAFGITQELEKALRPKVWLKSGGYIVINQTEALVAIDINTGKYVGKSNRLEDTIVKTNIEAVKEIVRQIRLRDLGGIIVVDFIDMDERKNRQKVMQALEEAMEADKAPYKILQFNDFGLVAITRKRVKQSLERTLCAPCPYCEGAGYVKSVQTIISEILVEAQKIARAIEGKDVMLRVHPDVARVLKANDNKYLEELEEILGRPVLVKSDATLHHEKFDLG
jgi:ribonuclease G